MSGSKPLFLAAEDWKKIGAGALIATVGAVLAYLADSVLPDLQERGILDAALFVFFSTLVNAARKFVQDTRRPFVWLALAISVIGGSASAAEPIVLDTDGAVPGRYFYEITIAADGSVSLRPLSRVVKLGTPSSPDPQPPLPNPDPPADTVSAKIKALTITALSNGGSQTTALGLSAVYSSVGDRVANGTTAPDAGVTMSSSAVAAVLGTQADGAKWADWKTGLDAIVIDKISRGELASKDQVVIFLTGVADGLKRGVAGNATAAEPDKYLQTLAEVNALLDSATLGRHRVLNQQVGKFLGGIDIQRLIELIQLIIALLDAFKGNAMGALFGGGVFAFLSLVGV